MLKNRFNGCHGNHAFFHSAIEFIFEDKNSLHFWGPNERFGTHEKLSWGGGGCKVGQISSRGKSGCNFVNSAHKAKLSAVVLYKNGYSFINYK